MGRSEQYWSSLAAPKVRASEFSRHGCRCSRSQKRVFSRAPSWIPRSDVLDDPAAVSRPSARRLPSSVAKGQRPAQQPSRGYVPDERLRLVSAGSLQRAWVMPSPSLRAHPRQHAPPAFADERTIPSDVQRHFTPTPPRMGRAAMRAGSEHVYAQAMAQESSRWNHTARPRTTPGASGNQAQSAAIIWSPRSARGQTITMTTPMTRDKEAQADSMRVIVRKMRTEKEQARKREQVNAFRTAFNIIDKDGNGEVEPDEVLKLVRTSTDAQGRPRRINEANFWSTFRKLDIDNNGKIDIEEFLSMLMALANERQREKEETLTVAEGRDSRRSSPQPRRGRDSLLHAGGGSGRGSVDSATTVDRMESKEAKRATAEGRCAYCAKLLRTREWKQRR